MACKNELTNTEMEYLGMANGWGNRIPAKLQKCRDANHAMWYKMLNQNGTLIEYGCNKCNICYQEDSSD